MGEEKERDNWWKAGIACAVIAAFLVSSHGLSLLTGISIIAAAIMVMALIAFAKWLSKSFETVGGKEKGIRLRFQEPVGITKPGLQFVPYGIEKLERAPSTQYNVNFEPKEITTKEEEYKGKTYHSVIGRVNTALYLILPEEEDDLIECYRRLENFSKENIKNHFNEATFGAVRVAIGNMTWKECSENRKKIEKGAKEILDNEAESPFNRAKITNWYLAITDIKWPEEIEKALALVDQRQMESEAAEFVALAHKKEIGDSLVGIREALEKGNFSKEILDETASQTFRDKQAGSGLRRYTWNSEGKGEGKSGSGMDPEAMFKMGVTFGEGLRESREGTGKSGEKGEGTEKKKNNEERRKKEEQGYIY